MVPRSTYFIQPFCDRCDKDLSEERAMSFFTGETICLDCCRKEEEIMATLREIVGPDADLVYQGCGFLPKPNGVRK
jgi:hypothetical protein